MQLSLWCKLHFGTRLVCSAARKSCSWAYLAAVLVAVYYLGHWEPPASYLLCFRLGSFKQLLECFMLRLQTMKGAERYQSTLSGAVKQHDASNYAGIENEPRQLGFTCHDANSTIVRIWWFPQLHIPTHTTQSDLWTADGQGVNCKGMERSGQELVVCVPAGAIVTQPSSTRAEAVVCAVCVQPQGLTPLVARPRTTNWGPVAHPVLITLFSPLCYCSTVEDYDIEEGIQQQDTLWQYAADIQQCRLHPVEAVADKLRLEHCLGDTRPAETQALKVLLDERLLTGRAQRKHIQRVTEWWRAAGT